MCGHVARLRSSRVHMTSLTCQDLPGFPLIFPTASDKNLGIGKAVYEANHYPPLTSTVQVSRHCLFHVTSYELQVVSYELRVTSYELQGMTYRLKRSFFDPWDMQ